MRRLQDTFVTKVSKAAFDNHTLFRAKIGLHKPECGHYTFQTKFISGNVFRNILQSFIPFEV